MKLSSVCHIFACLAIIETGSPYLAHQTNSVEYVSGHPTGCCGSISAEIVNGKTEYWYHGFTRDEVEWNQMLKNVIMVNPSTIFIPRQRLIGEFDIQGYNCRATAIPKGAEVAACSSTGWRVIR
jgi:hypothetical protein